MGEPPATQKYMHLIIIITKTSRQLQAGFWSARLRHLFRHIRAVAGGAIFRRRLVEEDLLRVHLFEQFVAIGAFHILVSSAQRKLGSLVVIEQGRLPFGGIMAVGAGGRLPFSELLSMDVLVAILAQGGGCLKVGVDQLGSEVRGLVAIDAGRRPMGALEGELGLGMIEP